MDNYLMVEYNEFMKWFRSNHPELHSKYWKNIDLPKEAGAGVSINQEGGLTMEEKDLVLEVVNGYYGSEQ